MSFKLSNLAKAEKSIDVRENDKDVREIDIHLAEVLRLIDPFNFVPAVHFAQRTDITNAFEPLRRRENLPILIDSNVELFMYLIATLGSVHEKFDVWGLIDLTLSNTRRFYSSKGYPLGSTGFEGLF